MFTMLNSHRVSSKAIKNTVRRLEHFAVVRLIPLSCKVMWRAQLDPD